MLIFCAVFHCEMWMQGGAVLLDMVSLFPAENGVEGSISPFRSDILSLIRGLQPRQTFFPYYIHGWPPQVSLILSLL